MTKTQHRRAEAIAYAQNNGYKHRKHLKENAKSKNIQYHSKIAFNQNNITWFTTKRPFLPSGTA